MATRGPDSPVHYAAPLSTPYRDHDATGDMEMTDEARTDRVLNFVSRRAWVVNAPTAESSTSGAGHQAAAVAPMRRALSQPASPQVGRVSPHIQLPPDSAHQEEGADDTSDSGEGTESAEDPDNPRWM